LHRGDLPAWCDAGSRRLHDARHILSAGIDVDMLRSHVLLAFTAMAIERVEEGPIGAGELVRLNPARKLDNLKRTLTRKKCGKV
jgi:hypothetical protein